MQGTRIAKYLLGVIFIILLFQSTTNHVQAQTCSGSGVVREITNCGPVGTNPCAATAWKTYSYNCGWYNGQCVGLARNQICGFRDGECQPISGSPEFVTISPCGGSTGGGGGGCTNQGWTSATNWRCGGDCGDGECVKGAGNGECKCRGNTPNPSCSVDLQADAISISAGGGSSQLTAVVGSIANGTVSSVNFSILSGAGNISVSPASDTSASYQTTVTGINAGSASILAEVIMGGSARCNDVTTVTINPANPWWQVKDGSILTNGSLVSSVPASSYFNTVGDGGFPGVPVYGGSLTLGSGAVSATGWNANTTSSLKRLFDFSYFENLIPGDVTLNDSSLLSLGAPSQYGYEWIMYDGDLAGSSTFTISDNLNLGSRKVILFVKNASLNINGMVNLTDGSGFFAAIVDGAINVGSSVTNDSLPALEGIYLSDGAFSTGLGTEQLVTRGSVAAHGGVSLQRDLANDSLPAEVFEFAPDQMLLFPQKLSFRQTRWNELNP